MRKAIILFLLSILLFSCGHGKQEEEAKNGAFAAQTEQTDCKGIDLEDIQANGELIIGTLSGPDTYYDYHGRAMGHQYALAENYAQSEGLRIRVVPATDTAQLFTLLRENDIDIAALQIPHSMVEKSAFSQAGAKSDSLHTSWVVRSGAKHLAASLNSWYNRGVDLSIENAEKQQSIRRKNARRRVLPQYLDQERGIISQYDHLFKSASKSTGWDWRLLAAQCYQESGFDADAVSWAGAMGLMQIMPETAKLFDLSEEHYFSPSHNVRAAAAIINSLNRKFADIERREERVKFVLAAYNGGAGHVRDAMALAEKHGKDAKSWSDVRHYILALSHPEYYRDPVVQHGYMIGAETENYVSSIMECWRAYGGNPSDVSGVAGNFNASPSRARKSNKYTKDTRVLSPEELQQSSREP